MNQNQVGLLLANGVPLKYKGTVEVIESEFNRNRNIALDLAFQILKIT
jgi:hypothetical protein